MEKIFASSPKLTVVYDPTLSFHGGENNINELIFYNRFVIIRQIKGKDCQLNRRDRVAPLKKCYTFISLNERLLLFLFYNICYF